jgi:hypothetical protein
VVAGKGEKHSAHYMGQIMTHIGTRWSKHSAFSAITVQQDTPMQGENSAKDGLHAWTHWEWRQLLVKVAYSVYFCSQIGL